MTQDGSLPSSPGPSPQDTAFAFLQSQLDQAIADRDAQLRLNVQIAEEMRLERLAVRDRLLSDTFHPPITIALVNRSTVISDDDVEDMANAFQTAITQHFAPYWGIDARIIFVRTGNPIPSGSWQVIMLDDLNSAGILGWHDRTSEGLPIGKVYAKLAKQYGWGIDICASHEIFEMMLNPYGDLLKLGPDGKYYIREGCDPCNLRSYKLGQYRDGRLIYCHDFTLPAWWLLGFNRGPFTYMQTIGDPYSFDITRAFQLALGGLLNYLDGGAWHTVTTLGATAMLSGRRERATRPRDTWRNSTGR